MSIPDRETGRALTIVDVPGRPVLDVRDVDDSFKVTVYARPAPKGSKTYRGKRKDGTPILVEAAGEYLVDFLEAVRHEAVKAHAGRPPMDGPLVLCAIFTLARPKSISAKKRPHPTTKPDLGKFVRAIEDALKQAGVIIDDAQFVDEFTRKRYNDHPEALRSPGVRIAVTRLDEGW